MVSSSSGLLLLVLLLASSCRRTPETLPPVFGSPAPATNASIRAYPAKGVVIAVHPGQKSVEIQHDAIPGYMPPMTMPFDVRDTNELAGLVAGQPVTFKLVVTATNGWVEQLRKTGAPVAANLTARSPLRLAPEVQPLELGDMLPEYHFTNQFGQIISTRQFKGQALALTFLFTRCPFPNFCPRMANTFEETQQKLLARAQGPTNWHLLTLSFDPEFDTPEVLKAYAQGHGYDPARWTFATGSLVDITAMGEQFGLAFWHDETGSISHNLRTAVIDASGRVQHLFEGNQWSSDELAAEMVRAATVAAR